MIDLTDLLNKVSGGVLTASQFVTLVQAEIESQGYILALQGLTKNQQTQINALLNAEPLIEQVLAPFTPLVGNIWDFTTGTKKIIPIAGNTSITLTNYAVEPTALNPVYFQGNVVKDVNVSEDIELLIDAGDGNGFVAHKIDQTPGAMTIIAGSFDGYNPIKVFSEFDGEQNKPYFVDPLPVDVNQVAGAEEPVIFRWFGRNFVSSQILKNGNAIPNATGMTLVISEPDATSVAGYSVKITSYDGSIEISDEVVYNRRPEVAPVITRQPTAGSVNAGSAYDNSVAATGFPLTYQWQYATMSNGSDAVPISGQTAAALSGYVPTASGFIACVVTAGSSVTSNYVAMTVNLLSQAAPTAPVTDITARTYSFTDASGKTSTSPKEYTQDGGTTVTQSTTKPLAVDDNAHAAGQLGVRYPADSTHAASAWLYNDVDMPAKHTEVSVTHIFSQTNLTYNSTTKQLSTTTSGSGYDAYGVDVAEYNAGVPFRIWQKYTGAVSLNSIRGTTQTKAKDIYTNGPFLSAFTIFSSTGIALFKDNNPANSPVTISTLQTNEYVGIYFSIVGGTTTATLQRSIDKVTWTDIQIINSFANVKLYDLANLNSQTGAIIEGATYLILS